MHSLLITDPALVFCVNILCNSVSMPLPLLCLPTLSPCKSYLAYECLTLLNRKVYNGVSYI